MRHNIAIYDSYALYEKIYDLYRLSDSAYTDFTTRPVSNYLTEKRITYSKEKKKMIQ